MDFPHLVFPLPALKLLKSPALHYAALGGLWYAAVSLWGTPPAAPPLLIPTSRVESALQEYERLSGRPLSPEESRIVTKAVVDQEVLYAYAKQLGLDKDPVVKQRLAQIATFVSENPHEAKSAEERADEAVSLGIGEGDLVVRRIMIDGARRLIRAGILVREPPDPLLEQYLRDHPEQFQRPARTRLSQVLIDAHKPRAEQDARDLLQRLRRDAVPPNQAGNYGDAGLVKPELPDLPERELERLFGHRFTADLAKLPVGEWSGPVASRYGMHLVFVRERVMEHTPPLAEVRKEVRTEVRAKLADEWLAVRLEQLKGEFSIQIADGDKTEESKL